MSAMANTTPIVTTVTKTTNKKKTPKEADATLKDNILDFCEEHYEDILPVIMDKIHRDKRKEVHVRLDFEENPKKSQRVREGSQNSSAGTLPARYRNLSKRPKMRDRMKYNDGDVFDRLGHRRQSAFDRLSNTYSPNTTKSGPDRANSRDRSHSRGHPRRRDSSSSIDRPQSRSRPRGIEESYGNTCPTYRTGARHRYHAHDRDRSRSIKKRESESPLSRVLESDTSDEGYWKSKSKRRKPTGTARVWFGELPPKSIDGPFFAYFMQQNKYVKDLVEIRNIKQRDGETIEDFVGQFKRLNEHVPKTMEEMMTATTAFIQGETAAASKKKGLSTAFWVLRFASVFWFCYLVLAFWLCLLLIEDSLAF
nr:hypothetical protein [Tanacetum cinerariifolium]